MNNRIFLLIAFVLSNAFQMVAQDDLYFVPSKKKTKKEQALATYESQEYDNWAEGRDELMDVDSYNRRNYTSKNEEYSYDEQASETESLTNRIVRFHAPGITIVSSPYYSDYIDIYTDIWFSVYRPYGWHSYSWYNPWWWDYPYYWSSPYYHTWWGWHGHYHPTYFPGHHHAWYPHYGGHHHQHYPLRAANKRPMTSNRGYRPSTERGARPSTNRDSRPSAERRSTQRSGNISTERTGRQPNYNTQNHSSRKQPSTTATPHRTERTPQRTMGSGGASRSQRSMGGSGGGRRR